MMAVVVGGNRLSGICGCDEIDVVFYVSFPPFVYDSDSVSHELVDTKEF
jgi:hypothetical protein